MSIDYRALIRDRQEKQTRPIVRHEVCLVPELYAELEEAIEARDLALSGVHDDDGNLNDPRAGGSAVTPELQAAQAVVADVERRLSESSVTLVFKAPTADQQAVKHDELGKLKADDPENYNRHIVEQTRRTILECLDHVEGPGREPIDLGRDDFAPVIAEWTHGEVVQLGHKLQNASVGAPDLPFSVQRSLRNRPSAATSKRR